MVNEMVKIVYEDDKNIKTVKGRVISDEEFLIVIKSEGRPPISIGKRFIVQKTIIGDY